MIAWNSRRTILLVAAALATASLGGDCDGDILDDPAFRSWCGDKLCAWTLDVGQIHPVPTWIPEDLGVSFDATPTQISQVTSESQATCILFTTVANFDDAAGMTLLVDFNNDGTIDWQQPLPTAAWDNVQTEITAPPVYAGITYHIRKNGTGTAVLAEMRAQSTTGCTAAAPALEKLLLGDVCSTDGQCASGICSGVNDLDVSTCAACSATIPCERAPICANGLYEFSQCAPAQHQGKPGELCVTNSDCVSDSCSGFSVVSEVDAGAGDGGLTGEDDCNARETDAGLAPAPRCLPVQAVVQGGTCD